MPVRIECSQGEAREFADGCMNGIRLTISEDEACLARSGL